MLQNKVTAPIAAVLICMVGIGILLHGCGGDPSSDLGLGEERADNDEAEITTSMIDAIKVISRERHPDGLMQRFNQGKNLGCFDAKVTVATELDAKFQHGVFQPGANYSAKIRFANATKTDDREKDFRGMSIKLFDVPGTATWGKDGVQDFLLNSYPALFSANPKDFLSFIEATRDSKLWRYFIRPSHFYSLRVILKGRETIDNPFAIHYWSTTPYRFGPDRSQAVKYSVRPCTVAPTLNSERDNEDFLRDVMQTHLHQAPACFDFMVQFQRSPTTMPIENAAVVWDETQSPFIKIATVVIADQSFREPEAMAQCEVMSFSPWQTLEAHRPLGGINRVRKPVYSEIATFRRNENTARNR